MRLPQRTHDARRHARCGQHNAAALHRNGRQRHHLSGHCCASRRLALCSAHGVMRRGGLQWYKDLAPVMGLIDSYVLQIDFAACIRTPSSTPTTGDFIGQACSQHRGDVCGQKFHTGLNILADFAAAHQTRSASKAAMPKDLCAAKAGAALVRPRSCLLNPCFPAARH